MIVFTLILIYILTIELFLIVYCLKIFLMSFLLCCFFWVLFRLWFLWPDDTLKNKRCRNKCGCLGGCRFFGGTVTGLDFFKLEELTPSSSSAFSSISAESDMYYGQSLLQPGEWIITKEIPKTVDGNKNVSYVWS